MKTSEALFKQHGKKFITLSSISEELLGIKDPKTLSRKANRGDLGGIKAFKLRKSGDWLVDIEQLAEVLDSRARG